MLVRTIRRRVLGRGVRSATAWLATLAGVAAQDAVVDELVFRSDRGGGEDGLYRMRADGGGVRRIVPNDRDVIHFALHPSGRRVAYVCDPKGDESFELTVLDLDTGEREAVHRGICLAPAWSRDGTRLAFMHYDRRWRIHLTDPDVKVQRPEQDHIGGDGAPSWFPDGRTIAFQSNRSGELELFSADTSTGVATRVTRTERAESSPSVTRGRPTPLASRSRYASLATPTSGRSRSRTARSPSA